MHIEEVPMYYTSPITSRINVLVKKYEKMANQPVRYPLVNTHYGVLIICGGGNSYIVVIEPKKNKITVYSNPNSEFSSSNARSVY